MRRRYNQKKALIMGYGLNKDGSGVAAARYLAQQGAILTVTDLRSYEELADNLAQLKAYSVRYVLGHHEQADFDEADLVVKNPGVKRSSTYLKHVSWLESDISLFLEATYNPCIAVTGSKGKSTTVSLLYHLLQDFLNNQVRLAGNITVSPLSFIDQLDATETIILELSSWQLGDLVDKNLLVPQIAIMTNLLHDHQNYYDHDMAAYAFDKAQIFKHQTADHWAILNLDDAYTPYFNTYGLAQRAYITAESLPPVYLHGVSYNEEELIIRVNGVDSLISLSTERLYHASNIAFALMAAVLYGMPLEQAVLRLDSFKGIEHRCEQVAHGKGLWFYNDSAATIADATVSSVLLLHRVRPLVLIVGGAYKESPLESLTTIFPFCQAIYLLDGTASSYFIQLFEEHKQLFFGPYTAFKPIFTDIKMHLGKKEEISVLLSPGCASFGLFSNEFDRGRQFKKAVVDFLA
jgi:UDP-N-acetylmuramoylalanine--D-glutamate ligase